MDMHGGRTAPGHRSAPGGGRTADGGGPRAAGLYWHALADRRPAEPISSTADTIAPSGSRDRRLTRRKAAAVTAAEAIAEIPHADAGESAGPTRSGTSTSTSIGGHAGTAAGCGSGRSSWLVTPGTTPGRFSASAGADVTLLDLEDAVPAALKDRARSDVLDYLQVAAGDAGSSAVGVRVNAPGTVAGLRDLAEVAARGLWPGLLLIPKVESARDIELVARIMAESAGASEIWALIESPRAVANLTGIVRGPGLAGVVFGAADYATEAGCRIASRATGHARAVLAAAAGLPAVDTPYFGLLDLDGLRREAEEAEELGFVGKVAIHPRQLPVIHQAFRPRPADVAAARAVITAADAADGAITTAASGMVGPPIVAAARTLTARALTGHALPGHVLAGHVLAGHASPGRAGETPASDATRMGSGHG